MHACQCMIKSMVEVRINSYPPRWNLGRYAQDQMHVTKVGTCLLHAKNTGR